MGKAAIGRADAGSAHVGKAADGRTGVAHPADADAGSHTDNGPGGDAHVGADWVGPRIMPAATVLFVASSMRMKLPVSRLRR